MIVKNMNPENIISIVPGKTDADLAAEFKQRIVEAHEPLLRLFDEIKAAGFEPQVICAPGPLGKHVITNLMLVKKF